MKKKSYKIEDTFGVHEEDGDIYLGQPCYLRKYGNKAIERMLAEGDLPGKPGEIAPPNNSTNMNKVIREVMSNLKRNNSTRDFHINGLRTGLGWIYGSLLIAKENGCTNAVINILSNDGDLFMIAWNKKYTIAFSAHHVAYYGNP